MVINKFLLVRGKWFQLGISYKNRKCITIFSWHQWAYPKVLLRYSLHHLPLSYNLNKWKNWTDFFSCSVKANLLSACNKLEIFDLNELRVSKVNPHSSSLWLDFQVQVLNEQTLPVSYNSSKFSNWILRASIDGTLK